MSVFRPPPEYFCQKAVRAYERQFRRKVPQWVLTLGDSNIQTLVVVAMRLKWKLSPKILVVWEQHSGPTSLWSDQRIRIDGQTEFLVRQKSLDLMKLPVDPAKVAAKGKKPRRQVKHSS